MKMKKNKSLITYKYNRIIYFGDAIKVKCVDKLTKNQAKIAILSASKVNSDDTHDSQYTITFKEFAELANIKSDEHEYIYKEVKKLTKLGIDIVDKDGKIIIFNWLNEVAIEPKTGIITYYIDRRLLPFYKLAKKTKQFTKINLLDYMLLKSKYSVVLYEFLAMWQKAGRVKQTINQLREQLQVNKNKYRVAKDFVRYCIKEPINDINLNAKNAFTVDVEYEKGSRNTVLTVTFFIKTIKNIDPQPVVASNKNSTQKVILNPEFQDIAKRMLEKNRL